MDIGAIDNYEVLNQQRLNYALFEQVVKGDIEKVKELLSEGADIKAVNQQGYTALEQAVRLGNQALTEVLIASGARICAENQSGFTILMHAICCQHTELAEYLIKLGADVNKPNAMGLTPLMIAVEAKSIQNIKLLIKYGANVNAVNQNGMTAIIIAVIKNNVKMAKVLIKKGANLTQENRSLVMFAVHHNNMELMQLLVENQAELNFQNDQNFTPLIIAIVKGQTEIAIYLIEKGADVNLKNIYGQTALIFAVHHKNSLIVNCLIKHSANATLADSEGKTALIHAACNADLQNMEKLIHLDRNNITSAFIYGCVAKHYNIAFRLLCEMPSEQIQAQAETVTIIRPIIEDFYKSLRENYSKISCAIGCYYSAQNELLVNEHFRNQPLELIKIQLLNSFPDWYVHRANTDFMQMHAVILKKIETEKTISFLPGFNENNTSLKRKRQDDEKDNSPTKKQCLPKPKGSKENS